MKFGIPEIIEYEKTCTDPFVLSIIKQLHAARSKNSQWCAEVVRLHKKIQELKRVVQAGQRQQPSRD